MERVIVSIKRDFDQEAHDIEVPAGMPILQLASSIARSLGWSMDAQGRPVFYEVGAQPPGRILKDDETLAQVGAWDGAWLIFYRKEVSPGTPASAETPMKGLIGTYKPIEVKDNSHDDKQGPDHASTSVPWKQLDD